MEFYNIQYYINPSYFRCHKNVFIDKINQIIENKDIIDMMLHDMHQRELNTGVDFEVARTNIHNIAKEWIDYSIILAYSRELQPSFISKLYQIKEYIYNIYTSSIQDGESKFIQSTLCVEADTSSKATY